MINAKPPFWETFRKTNGALSCAEAAFILQVAELAPQGIYIVAAALYPILFAYKLLCFYYRSTLSRSFVSLLFLLLSDKPFYQPQYRKEYHTQPNQSSHRDILTLQTNSADYKPYCWQHGVCCYHRLTVRCSAVYRLSSSYFQFSCISGSSKPYSLINLIHSLIKRPIYFLVIKFCYLVSKSFQTYLSSGHGY